MPARSFVFRFCVFALAVFAVFGFCSFFVRNSVHVNAEGSGPAYYQTGTYNGFYHNTLSYSDDVYPYNYSFRFPLNFNTLDSNGNFVFSYDFIEYSSSSHLWISDSFAYRFDFPEFVIYDSSFDDPIGSASGSPIYSLKPWYGSFAEGDLSVDRQSFLYCRNLSAFYNAHTRSFTLDNGSFGSLSSRPYSLTYGYTIGSEIFGSYSVLQDGDEVSYSDFYDQCKNVLYYFVQWSWVANADGLLFADSDLGTYSIDFILMIPRYAPQVTSDYWNVIYPSGLPPVTTVVLSDQSEYNNGYNIGYSDGLASNNSAAYLSGVDVGFNNGFQQGYHDGYIDGVDSLGVSPFDVFISGMNSLLNIPLFGPSITVGLLFAIAFGILMLGLVLKVFLGG